jgi:GNAT superfamily N-acetyltransferase
MQRDVTDGEDLEQSGTASDEQQRLTVRLATPTDAASVAGILAEAFPGLYRSAFGGLEPHRVVRLLTALYCAGSLSLEATRVAERGGRVVGLAILHIGKPIGRGTAGTFWRTIREALPWGRRLRAFAGGLAASTMLSRRIPHAADLVYIEALAVAANERGKGVGSLLLQDAAEWALQRQRNRLALHVLSTNYRARRLYERVGFRPWTTRQSATTRIVSSASSRKSGWTALLMLRQL